MKTIAFLGSPRKNGNTELLLKEAVKGVEGAGSTVQIFHLNLMKIKPCQDCGSCNETGKCVFQDDMEQVYDAIRSADRVILASPIFFFSLSAQTKLMIDRCQSFWCEKYILNQPVHAGKYGRKGLLLLVAGMKTEEGVRCAEISSRAFFRTISIPEHSVLSFAGIDSKGEILKHPTALKEAYDVGRKLVEF